MKCLLVLLMAIALSTLGWGCSGEDLSATDGGPDGSRDGSGDAGGDEDPCPDQDQVESAMGWRVENDPLGGLKRGEQLRVHIRAALDRPRPIPQRRASFFQS